MVKKIAVLYIKHTCTKSINLQFFLPAPVAQVVECPRRGTGGHGSISGRDILNSLKIVLAAHC